MDRLRAIALTVNRRRVVFLFVLAFALIGAAVVWAYRAPPLTPAFIVYPGATSVRLHTGAGPPNISYDVAQEFPATELIEYVKASVCAQGATVLSYDPMNVEDQNSHVRGWMQSTDASKVPAEEMHVWTGGWAEVGGSVVIYSIYYEEPAGDTSGAWKRVAHVIAYQLPAKVLYEGRLRRFLKRCGISY